MNNDASETQRSRWRRPLPLARLLVNRDPSFNSPCPTCTCYIKTKRRSSVLLRLIGGLFISSGLYQVELMMDEFWFGFSGNQINNFKIAFENNLAQRFDRFTFIFHCIDVIFQFSLRSHYQSKFHSLFCFKGRFFYKLRLRAENTYDI